MSLMNIKQWFIKTVCKIEVRLMNKEYYEDKELPVTEWNLSKDLKWELIQSNILTRWANEYLKTVYKQGINLKTNLFDDLKLRSLNEVICGKKSEHVNKKWPFIQKSIKMSV